MPLQKQIVSVNFAQGLDQKTDDKLTGKLLTADNAVLRKTGTIEKRLGFVADGTWSDTRNPVKCFPFNNGKISITDYSLDNNSEQHSSVRSGGIWKTDSNPFYSLNVRTLPLVSEAYSATLCDLAIGGHSATQIGQVSYIVSLGASWTINRRLDLDTEVMGVARAGRSSTSFRPITLTSSSTIVTYVQPANAGDTGIAFDIENINTGSLTLAGLVLGMATVNPQLDAVSFNSKIYFAAKQSSSTGIIVGWFDPSNSTTSITVIPASTTADILTIATPLPTTDRICLFWMKNNTSNTGFIASYSATLSQILAPTTVTVGVIAYGPGLITQLAAVETGAAATWALMFTQSSTTGLPTYTAWNGLYNSSGASSGTGEGGFKSCSLASKPFIAHNTPYVILNHSASAQQSFFVATSTTPGASSLRVAARTSFGLAGPNSITYSQLPAVSKVDEDTFYTVIRRANYFTSQAGNITAAYGYDLLEMNFSQSQSIPFVQSGDSLYLGGGYLKSFDGFGIVESGFLSYPVTATVSTTTTGGSLTSGAYSVVILKEFVDEKGRTQKGTPSLPVTFTTSTTTSAATVTFSDGPNFKSIDGVRPSQIRYTAFRTQGNLSIYYRDAASAVILGGAARYPTSITPLSISLTISDAVLSGGDVIYTQGGSLPNWTPDGVRAICEHKERLFCNDSSDVVITRYSKRFTQGEGVAFAQANIINHPGAGGKVTAYSSLDSNLIGFKSRYIFVISGDGPDDTGLGGSFYDGQLLFADIGCIDQRNLCRFRDGIIFKSPDKGFYLLTRDLQLKYIGADVEDYNAKTVVSSEVVAIAEVDGAAEECRFLCSDGTLLTYNYYNGQWTTGTLTGCVDAVQSGGRYVVVNTSTTATSARVFQQSTSTYTDDFLAPASVTYQMTIESGWLKMGDVQGFQRIWNVQVIGKSQGPGNISVEVGYDFETAYTETHTATMSSLTAANYSGGNTTPPQCNFVPTRQKCEAIRFRVKDIPSAGNTSGVFRLTNISLECGVKSGGFKLPPAKGI